MSEEVTSQIQPIDWTWANERLTLPIYNAVSLSLGYEINALAPVDQAWVGRPFVQPPEDYKQRVATTYEAVRMSMLSCHTTTKNGATFDLAAKFSDAQFWEVSTVEFRRFCDERGWQVPSDFLPNGYVPTVLPTDHDNATPAPVAKNGASNALNNGKVWTPEKLAEAGAYREKYGTKKTAAHYQVSEARIRYLLPGDKPKPKGYSAFTHRMK